MPLVSGLCGDTLIAGDQNQEPGTTSSVVPGSCCRLRS